MRHEESHNTCPAYVYVPVPAHRVAEILSILAGMGDERPAPPAAPRLEWTEPELRRLWGESEETHRKLLRVLADADGAPISATALTQKIGKVAHSTLGALNRRVKSRHPGLGRPYVAVRPASTGEWGYLMPRDIAALMRQIAV
jgi:hypothetical protein